MTARLFVRIATEAISPKSLQVSGCSRFRGENNAVQGAESQPPRHLTLGPHVS
jgi:hypothetical protein